MSGSEIREMFLRFFEGKGHTRVHSSSLVPHNDPTLLFTNAGMNQFKDVFLGAEKRAYTRATTSQKCVRAGGKHNDLENVGFTRRHHTFFEMLGNFSFGDYFKKEAIAYAWELVTSKDWFGLDKDKLYVTIFKGENGVARDAEAYQFWLDVGVPKDRIFELGAKDNFWQMGETGPCGPCSEIYYDMGVAASDTLGPDLEPLDLPFGQDDARYVEIWNLVFMQFDRSADGKLTPLPKPCVDTGAGLERLAAVLQGKLSNFETDLFVPLIQRAAELVGVKPTSENPDVGHPDSSASLRIIADHARAATFLITDGVLPSNESRGYVLRKIMRRAIRHGRLLGQENLFLHQMVYAVRDEMQDAYPELKEMAERVVRVVELEEQQFHRVLKEGTSRLELELALVVGRKIGTLLAQDVEQFVQQSNRRNELELYLQILKTGEPHPLRNEATTMGAALVRSISNSAENARFSGRTAFHLYETFGLPLDFMVDATHDLGIAFDLEGFERARAEEQARARASWKGGSNVVASPDILKLAESQSPYEGLGGVLDEAKIAPELTFVGYGSLEVKTRIVYLALLDSNQIGYRQSMSGTPGRYQVVLENCPFYAAGGGQAGDTGWLYSASGYLLASVVNCESPVRGVRVLTVEIPHDSGRALRPTSHDACLVAGSEVIAKVDAVRRFATMRNHTGTHLLHAALRETLGTHVKQAGSLNDPQRLRFDFSHFTQVADEELQDIESLINKNVLANTRVETIEDVPIDDAINTYHAMALFGEKYGERVRVVKIGDFSTELCGGTHTAATGEIGLVKIVSEGSVSSGVRRIEAITGTGALQEFRRDFAVTKLAEQIAGKNDALSPAEALQQKLSAQEDELKRLRRELDEARMKSAAGKVKQAAAQAIEVKGVKVLAQRVDALDRNQMRTLVDNLRNQIGSGVVVLGGAQEDKVALIVGVTKDLTSRVQAGKIVGQLAQKVGGSGGGRPDMAEAGGKDVSQLDAALASTAEIVGALLG